MRYTKSFGINDTVFSLTTGTFAETLDTVIVYICTNVIVGKLIPKGTEGTIMALTGTLIQTNLFLIRGAVGVLANKIAKVTKENMQNYY